MAVPAREIADLQRLWTRRWGAVAVANAGGARSSHAGTAEDDASGGIADDASGNGSECPLAPSNIQQIQTVRKHVEKQPVERKNF